MKKIFVVTLLLSVQALATPNVCQKSVEVKEDSECQLQIAVNAPYQGRYVVETCSTDSDTGEVACDYDLCNPDDDSYKFKVASGCVTKLSANGNGDVSEGPIVINGNMNGSCREEACQSTNCKAERAKVTSEINSIFAELVSVGVCKPQASTP